MAKATSNLQSVRFSHDSQSIAKDFADHLKYDADSGIFHQTQEGRYEALAATIRDRMVHQWNATRRAHVDKNAKTVYYLSLEFLMGRAMTNNINNMGMMDQVTQALKELGYSYEELADIEPDAGLGNGGLGRLAACFLDSLASLELPAYGYGIRYNYGIFKQLVSNGYQFEQPDNWLRYGNPWEIPRSDLRFEVNFGGSVQTIVENGKTQYKWVNTEKIYGMAYDMPIIGYGGKTVNTLRLWSAKALEDFNFENFNQGDYTQAVRDKVKAENISQVLYPNDQQYLGKVLRLKQQYFFVACSIADIIRRFKRSGKTWKKFPDMAAVQLNDTHPSIAVAELMRILLDQENLEWEEAWEITTKALAYTNHTLMPEALEKWPVPMMETLLPRHMQIIYEINRRFLQTAVPFFTDSKGFDGGAVSKVSIIEESNPKNVRMANLAIIGTHAVNGVAQLHTNLLKQKMFPEFNSIYPDKFQNKTNGITPRRWLVSANPGLTALISSAIGTDWITDASKLKALEKYAEDEVFVQQFARVKELNKVRAAAWLKKDCGLIVNPESIFDVQVKRIHEYKRQLLNAFDIVMIYQRLKNDRNFAQNFPPTTFLFGGKSAPGYVNAKLSIKFINSIATVINSDPTTNRKLQVHFMPNYRVTMAEEVIPAANISEQISTAGLEASGTGNMKFMLNGALTVGTLDGANVEILQEAGEENCFIFGHTVDEVAQLKPDYDPWKWILADEEIHNAVTLIRSNFFNIGEPDAFNSLFNDLFNNKDKYMIFADLRMYDDCRKKVYDLYRNDYLGFTKKAILNVANAGKFSSDRTILEYAEQIWNIKPCPVKIDTTDCSIDDARKN